ncbi:MAG: 6-bladed beta-propeller [Bacteroidales bacterium]|jgi:hypothetical protein|nr:6-bladed beta-propeller [Bacteroidales bacterium]
MKYCIYYLFISVALFSCTDYKTQRKDNPNLHVIDLDNLERASDLNFSDLFKNVVPVVLETTPNSLIGFINKLYITNDLIIILDNTTAKSIFVFNKEGDFLHKIGSFGGGPGQYVFLADFSIDTLNKIIYVLDSQTQKIHQYNIYSGEFIKSVKLNNNMTNWHIHYKNNEFYANGGDFSDTNNEFLLHRIDINSGETIEAWFNYTEYNKGVNFPSNNNKSPFLHTFQGDMKFHTFFMDTIMSITANEIMPFLTFASKNLLTKKDMENIDINSDFQKIYSFKKYFNLFTYFEFSDFILLQFLHGDYGRTVLYDTKNKSAKFVNFFDDLTYRESTKTFPTFVFMDQKGIYISVNLYIMNSFIEKRNNGELSLSLLNNRKIQELSEDSNEILLYYEFKH